MTDIEVGTAEAVESSRLRVMGAITYDQNRVSHIGPRTEGRIVALRVDLGSRVSGVLVRCNATFPEPRLDTRLSR